MRMIRGFFLPLLLNSLVTSSACGADAFDAPECALWHEGTQAWYVSNLGGPPGVKDGDGWITRLDQQGNVTAARWVEGLHAPTGMAAVGNLLFIGDIDAVVVIDTEHAAIVERLQIEGAEFVNDVAAAPNGDLYVSDTFANRIYRLPQGTAPEIFLASPELDSPNGLLVDGDTLVVATWGPMTDRETFATRHPGKLLRVDLKTKQITNIGDGRPIANFDGIVKMGDRYLATDWFGGRLLVISQGGQVQEVLTGFRQLADLGFDPTRRVIGMPEMSSDRIFFLRLESLELSR